MGKILSTINIAFVIELLFVILIALGIMPREGALFLAIFLPVVLIISSFEDASVFIARSIPLFLALPLTENFDNFNIWRILILALFVKWLLTAEPKWRDMLLKNIHRKICLVFSGIIARSAPENKFSEDERAEPLEAERAFLKKHIPPLWQQFRMEMLLTLLFLFATLSLFNAEDLGAGIKRIVYFLNLGMLFFIIRHAINRDNLLRLGKNFIISGAIIAIVGIIQLISTYFIHIDNFAEYWAFVVERNLYGNTWASIAISANTWFAYFNETIHLRMFSSFPDSHSFPVYLLMTSIFVSLFAAITDKDNKKRLAMWLIIFAVFFLCIVLSGTRGIWAAATILLFVAPYLSLKTKKYSLHIWLPIIFFVVTLVISQPIFSSQQFKLAQNQESKQVLFHRIASIIDAGETSNQGRVWIWKESAKSIIRHPFLGVGIGNFPTVLKQDVSLAKAGSSAHNLFLQIIAEMGIFAFAIFIFIIYEIFKKAKRLSALPDNSLQYFGVFSILYLGWILVYTMTDPVIFDERVFLGLMILIGAIYGLNKTDNPKHLVN